MFVFVREKRIKGYRYLYLVESVREDGKTNQLIITNLGRKGAVLADGGLDRLASSVVPHAEHAKVLSAVERGDRAALNCRRIGAPLLFERLWPKCSIGGVLDQLLADRRFEFAVERAVFVGQLHRLLVPGSDLACEKWMDDFRINGIGGLQFHHFYRAMAWLGEERDEPGGGISPRCV